MLWNIVFYEADLVWCNFVRTFKYAIAPKRSNSIKTEMHLVEPLRTQHKKSKKGENPGAMQNLMSYA